MSNKNYKHPYKLIELAITEKDNPITWTDEQMEVKLDGKVIIGYVFRYKNDKPIVLIYTIEEKYLETKDKLITNNVLRSAFLQWLESLQENSKSIIFRNPPIKEWLDTKEEWCYKIARKLSIKYHKTFDSALSAVFFVIMKCYNSNKVYIGNLYYIEQCAVNKIKAEMVYMRNRLTGEHPMVISLDATPSELNASLDESIRSFHELLTEVETDNVKEQREIIDKAIADLKRDFSAREIEQILNNSGYLPMPLYRRLLKWRKEHKLEDYL